ncbi:MAG: hypothetical protein IIV14_00675 [Bacteroidaceae bacterium]|nr:hypothetical protein [Bacteroidaceae bacterium]
MSEEKILVEQTENVEQTTEETPVQKMYSQEEVDAIVGKAKARTKAKIQKEYDRKYGDLVDTLETGTGKKGVEALTETFGTFYRNKGFDIRKKDEYSAQDIEVLARADAAEIIGYGFEEVVEEADRLNKKGVENMTPRDKALFVALTNHIKTEETSRELSKLGVGEDVYNSKEFKEFAEDFKPGTPISKIYSHYAKTLPKKEHKTMGSMKNSTSENGTVKDFYTPDEARKYTKKDFDNNPALFKAVTESMLKW